MKLDKQLPQKEEIEIVGQKEVRKETRKIASIKPHRGHTLWEINVKNGEIKKAEYEQVDADFVDAINGGSIKKKVIQRKDHVYISALNQVNALKKMFKMFKQYDQFKQNQKQ